MSTNFVVTGERELNARLSALGQAPRDMLRDVGLNAVREAKILVHRRTGNLGRTIRIGELSDTYVEVRAGGLGKVGYAAAMEFGTRAHVIVPVRAKALAWGGPRTLGGRVRSGGAPTHFARRVRHPGTRPFPYLIPGLQKALAIVGIDKLVQRWNEAA